MASDAYGTEKNEMQSSRTYPRSQKTVLNGLVAVGDGIKIKWSASNCLRVIIINNLP